MQRYATPFLWKQKTRARGKRERVSMAVKTSWRDGHERRAIVDSVIISRAAEALEAGDKRLAENYLQLMPLTVKSSARIAVDLFTNAQRELDDDADVESIFLWALLRYVDSHRSGAPLVWRPADNEKSSLVRART